eukprot:442160_1
MYTSSMSKYAFCEAIARDDTTAHVWYYIDGSKEKKGPFNRVQMTQMYTNGNISDTTEIICQSVAIGHNKSYKPLGDWFAHNQSAFLLNIPTIWCVHNILHPTPVFSPVHITKTCPLPADFELYWFNPDPLINCPIISAYYKLQVLLPLSNELVNIVRLYVYDFTLPNESSQLPYKQLQCAYFTGSPHIPNELFAYIRTYLFDCDLATHLGVTKYFPYPILNFMYVQVDNTVREYDPFHMNQIYASEVTRICLQLDLDTKTVVKEFFHRLNAIRNPN